jgi:peptidoglycan/xylan/chitin deacetylase (PgdA/CDA1 family)
MESLPTRFKKNIFKAIAFFLFYTGLLKILNRIANHAQCKRNKERKLYFPFLNRRVSRNLQILIYHRINDAQDPFFPGTPVDAFKKQMAYLAANCAVLSLEDAVNRLKNRDLPDNAVVITFDDGYKDNFLNALPILKKLSIPASVFLATDAIGSDRVLWHDKVFAAFRETHVAVLEGVGHDSKVYSLTTLEDKLFAQREVLKFLWSLADCERLFWIDRLVERLRVINMKAAPDLMLNWDEIRIMQQSGIVFGSHTKTHPILSKVSTDRVRTEILQSKNVIEKNLGVPVTTFAYPVGRKQDFSESVKDLLKEAGYTCALTTMLGANEDDHDLFELKRATPWDNYTPAFATRLNWYKFCSYVSQR